ncbi:uncharacterized protein LOC144910486 [Branchiostoma floridae x Branchiostoma belcheri]
MAVDLDTRAVECHLYLSSRSRGKMPYTKPKRSRLMARIMYKMKTVNVQKPTLSIATVFPHHYTSKHLDLPIRTTPLKRESEEEGGCMAKGMKAEPVEFPEDLEETFHSGQLQQHCSLAAKHCRQDDGMLNEKARWGYYNKPAMTRYHSFKSYKGTTQSSPMFHRPQQTTSNNSSSFTTSCIENTGNRSPLKSSEVADSSLYLSTNDNNTCTSPQNPVSAGLGLEQSDERTEDNQNWKNGNGGVSSTRATVEGITCKEGIGENETVRPVLQEDIPRANPYSCPIQNMNLGERERAGQEDLTISEYLAFSEIPPQEELLSVEHDVKNNNVEEIIHSSLPGEEDNPPSPVFNSKAVLGALSNQGSSDEKCKYKMSYKPNDDEHCGFKVFSHAEGLVQKGSRAKAGLETLVSSRIPLSITGSETTDHFEASRQNPSTPTFWKEVVNDNYSSDSEPPFPLTQKYQAERDTGDCAVPDGDNLDSLIFPESPLLYSPYSEG